MKLLTRLLFSLFLLGLQSVTFAGSGELFSVSSSGISAPIKIILCLNASGPLSCQTYTTTNLNLSISTVVANHLYTNAGIKIVTPGFGVVSGCTPLGNGYCSFAVSDTSKKNIVLTSTNKVTFVGAGYDGSHLSPLSYTSSNNGNNWTISSGLPMLPSDGISGVTLRVACDATHTLCTTIGNYDNGSSNFGFTNVSSNGGQSWVLSASLPLPSGALESNLGEVVCDSSGSLCTMVGVYFANASTYPFVYTSANGGHSWILSPALPLPVGVYYRLSGVACAASGGHCVAVGDYGVTNSIDAPLVYTSNNGGMTWALSSALPTISGFNFFLDEVACDSTGMLCNAVAAKETNSSSQGIFYRTTNGGLTWNYVIPPQPANATYSELDAISCGGSGQNCIAAGVYYNGTTDVPLVYVTSNGGASWSLPAFLPQLLPGAVNSEIHVISCNAAATSCSIGGAYYNGSFVLPLTYITSDGGNTWFASAQQPALVAPTFDGILGETII